MDDLGRGDALEADVDPAHNECIPVDCPACAVKGPGDGRQGGQDAHHGEEQYSTDHVAHRVEILSGALPHALLRVLPRRRWP